MLHQHTRSRRANQIYSYIFDLDWVEKAFQTVRPYREQFDAWIKGKFTDESLLLSGQALSEAEAWAQDKALSPLDQRFLRNSQILAKQGLQDSLHALEVQNQEVTLEVQHKTDNLQKLKHLATVGVISFIGIIIGVGIPIALAYVATDKAKQEAVERAKEANVKAQQEEAKAQEAKALAQQEEAKAQEATIKAQQEEAKAQEAKALAEEAIKKQEVAQLENKAAQKERNNAEKERKLSFLEQQGLRATEQFNDNRQLEALILAMRNVHELRNEFGEDTKKHSYQFLDPLVALKYIVDNIQDKGELLTNFNSDISDGVNPLSSLSGNRVKALDITPDNQRIITFDRSGIASIWNMAGEWIHSFDMNTSLTKTETRVKAVDIHPNRPYVAVGGYGPIRIWNISAKQLGKEEAVIEDLEKFDVVEDISFSPDGKYLAAAGAGKKAGIAIVWDVSNLSSIQKVTEIDRSSYRDPSRIISIRFSPDSQSLATAGFEDKIHIWDLGDCISKSTLCEQQQPAQSLEGTEKRWSSNVQFSSNGQYIVAGGQDGIVRVWSISGSETSESKYQEVAQLIGHQGSVLNINLIDNHNGAPPTIVTGGADRTIRFWDIKGREFRKIDNFESIVQRLSLDSEGETMVILNEEDIPTLWSRPPTPIELAGWNTGLPKVRDIQFSPDGQQLITTGEGFEAQLWNSFTGEKISNYRHRGWRALTASFSQDGQYIAVGGDAGLVKIWNILENSNQEISKLFRKLRVDKIRFSPHGNYLASVGANGLAFLVNMDEEQELIQLIGHQDDILDVDFSPNGQSLVTAGEDHTIRIWNLSGQEQRKLSYHRDKVWSVSFSPDGQFLLSSSKDGTAKIWHTSGEREPFSINHQSSILDAKFSPDNQYIATASKDNNVILWDNQGRRLSQFYHPDDILSISFSPDGQRLATAGNEGIVRVWNVADLSADTALDIDTLLNRGCDWLAPYLIRHPEEQEISQICEINSIPN